MLEDINTKFDSIKSKLESILNGSSSDGQSINHTNLARSFRVTTLLGFYVYTN